MPSIVVSLPLLSMLAQLLLIVDGLALQAPAFDLKLFLSASNHDAPMSGQRNPVAEEYLQRSHGNWTGAILASNGTSQTPDNSSTSSEFLAPQPSSPPLLGPPMLPPGSSAHLPGPLSPPGPNLEAIANNSTGGIIAATAFFVLLILCYCCYGSRCTVTLRHRQTQSDLLGIAELRI